MLASYGEELLAACPTPNLEDHSLLALCDCLIYLLLPSTSGGYLLHLKSEDMLWHEDEGPT